VYCITKLTAGEKEVNIGLMEAVRSEARRIAIDVNCTSNCKLSIIVLSMHHSYHDHLGKI
jgi:hypothetical protein